MIKLKLATDNGQSLICCLEYEELIYGAVAVICPTAFDGMVLHPLTKKPLPVIVDNQAAEPYLLIPSHIQAHYAIAMKHGLPLKQVVAPLFVGEGSQAIRADLPIQERHSVIAVVQHCQNPNQYLCVDSLHRVCRSFVLGGREGDETPEQAALREVAEETGYTDVHIDHVYHIMLLNHFYADYKGINRHATLHIVFGHLHSTQCQPLSAKEATEHTVKWIDLDDLPNFISVKNNQFVVDLLQHGEQAYTGDGLMVNSEELNGLPRQVARQRMQAILQRIN